MSKRTFVHKRNQKIFAMFLICTHFYPHNVNKGCNFPQGSGAAAEFRNDLTSDEDYMNN